MPSQKQAGVALITVLIVISILAWVISYFIAQGRNNLDLVEYERDRILAEIEADSMIEEVMYWHYASKILNKEGGNYYGKRVDVSSSKQQPKWFELSDTSGRLAIMNLNTALASKLAVVDRSSPSNLSRFIDCYDDWQDQDDLKRLNGGESLWYLEQGLPEPRNAPMQSYAEFELMCGFPQDQASIDKLLNNVVLYHRGSFNPALASRELISVSDLPKDRKESLYHLARAGQQDKLNQLVGSSTSVTNPISLQLSNNLLLKLEVNVGRAQARREVVFSHSMRYNPRPLVQFWHWSEK
ncbi:hypothetical protein V1358_15120 [Pseudoalteromonas sp. YIC-656]|uniref:hypothetical protein n=1 Tax=Pseudoalteromonas pernae TaxID=3118054 RepID=UPI003242FD11